MTEKNKVVPDEVVKEVTEAQTSEIKAKDFDKEELMAIFDAIMFEGEYTETVTIKGKLKVVFGTRTADQTSEIEREIDGKGHVLLLTMNQDRAFLSLVHSVRSYAGKDISKMTVDERKKFLGKLPSVVVSALSDALVKFDAKTYEACREGEENF